MFEKLDAYFNEIVSRGIVTEDALNLLTGVNGYTFDVMNDAIFYATGYRSLEQYRGENF